MFLASALTNATLWDCFGQSCLTARELWQDTTSHALIPHRIGELRFRLLKHQETVFDPEVYALKHPHSQLSNQLKMPEDNDQESTSLRRTQTHKGPRFWLIFAALIVSVFFAILENVSDSRHSLIAIMVLFFKSAVCDGNGTSYHCTGHSWEPISMGGCSVWFDICCSCSSKWQPC